MDKLKNYIAENWHNIIAVILVSIAIVCILLDVVQVFLIATFYVPYIAALPMVFAVVLKLFCIQEENTGNGQIIYYGLGLASVEYLFLVLLDKMLSPSKFKITIYMVTVFYMLIRNKIGKGTVMGVEDENNQQEGKKKIFSLIFI